MLPEGETAALDFKAKQITIPRVEHPIGMPAISWLVERSDTTDSLN